MESKRKFSLTFFCFTIGINIFLALYFIDLEKGDLWIVIGLIGSIVLVAIEIFAVNRLGFSKSGGSVVLCVMYLMLFIISYALNSKKMENLKLDI